MSCRKLRSASFMLMVCLGLPTLSSSKPQFQSATTLQPKTSICEMPPEVRLRRIHLVRPDLIPYPIPFQEIC